MNARKILRLLGTILLVLGGFMSTSLVWGWIDEVERSHLLAWVTSVASTVAVGGTFWVYGRRQTQRERRSGFDDPLAGEITRREALVIVTFSWLLCSIFGGLPFLLCGMVDSPADAFFEAASGFTTTGSTILVDIESNARAALWWRSMIQWLGGMGIVVFFVAILAQSGSGGRKLFESEAPGPTKEQLQPRIRETGSVLWKLYGGLTAALVGLLLLQGVGGFDAVCHAFTCMATGGFSTKNASIAAFDSASIDWTLTVFMLIAGGNFSIYFALTRRGAGFRPLKDIELRVYLAIYVLATVAVTVSILHRHDGDLIEALRYGAFQTSSILTSTGFGTDDFDKYPAFARSLLVFLMFIGGMGGSTAGGYKVSRFWIAINTALKEIRHAAHPRAVFSTRIGGMAVEDRVVRQVLVLGVVIMGILGTSTLALALMGLDLETAFSAAMTCMFNCGPALNELGPVGNFSTVPDLGKLLLAMLMILGRLEFLTVLALCVPGFWTARGL